MTTLAITLDQRLTSASVKMGNGLVMKYTSSCILLFVSTRVLIAQQIDLEKFPYDETKTTWLVQGLTVNAVDMPKVQDLPAALSQQRDAGHLLDARSVVDVSYCVNMCNQCRVFLRGRYSTLCAMACHQQGRYDSIRDACELLFTQINIGGRQHEKEDKDEDRRRR